MAIFIRIKIKLAARPTSKSELRRAIGHNQHFKLRKSFYTNSVHLPVVFEVAIPVGYSVSQ
jgi:hypothetical protein